MEDIYLVGYEKKFNEKEMTSFALGYLSPIALGVWLYGLSISTPNKFSKLNSEAFFELSQISTAEFTGAIQELQKKKYLVALDKEAEVWEMLEYPSVEGVIFK